MIRDISLGGLEEIADVIAHFFYLREFREICFAAVEKLTISAEERRHVAVQIVYFELSGLSSRLSSRVFLFRRCFLDQRSAAWSRYGGVLLIGWTVGAPIDGRGRQGLTSKDPAESESQEERSISWADLHKDILIPNQENCNQTR